MFSGSYEQQQNLIHRNYNNKEEYKSFLNYVQQPLSLLCITKHLDLYYDLREWEVDWLYLQRLPCKIVFYVKMVYIGLKLSVSCTVRSKTFWMTGVICL